MNLNFDPNFLSMMQDLLQDEFADYLKSFEKPSFNGLRVNTLKISVTDFLKIAPFKLRPIPWTNDAFYIENKEEASKHPYYQAGLYYLQEPSAMLPAETLNINEGDLVLDTCAAPGGKSTKLACKLNRTGLLVSNDISASRAFALLKNLELFGSENIYVLAEDLHNLSTNFSNYFDSILIDAPCSGEGMFRKDPEMFKGYLKKDRTTYLAIQEDIITIAYQLLKDGGELVYSTCTFDPQENEGIIAKLLSKFPNAELIDIPLYPGFKKGLIYNGFDISKAVRLYPHLIEGEGHFCCHIKKIGNKLSSKEAIFKDDKIKNEEFQEFFKLLDFGKDHHLKTIKDDVYLLPNIPFSDNHLRVLRSGLKIGSLQKGRFRPSQALALSLNKDNYPYCINLQKDDIRVQKYLKGETIDVNDFCCHNGYNLVLVDGYPLGFANIKNGVFKNAIEKGWIRQ